MISVKFVVSEAVDGFQAWQIYIKEYRDSFDFKTEIRYTTR